MEQAVSELKTFADSCQQHEYGPKPPRRLLSDISPEQARHGLAFPVAAGIDKMTKRVSGE
jgi:hypothetical protein